MKTREEEDMRKEKEFIHFEILTITDNTAC